MSRVHSVNSQHSPLTKLPENYQWTVSNKTLKSVKKWKNASTLISNIPLPPK